MITALIKSDSKTVVLMGITPRNVELLQQGRPLIVEAEALGIPFEVVPIHGVNTAEIEEQFASLGIKRENADMTIDNRCADPNCKDCK